MAKIDLIVTRHKALVAYLIELGLADETTEVVTHVAPDQVRGKNVCGVLPHSLSSLCESFTEVPLHLPVDLRGVELTLEQVREYSCPAVTYKVEKVE